MARPTDIAVENLSETDVVEMISSTKSVEEV